MVCPPPHAPSQASRKNKGTFSIFTTKPLQIFFGKIACLLPFVKCLDIFLRISALVKHNGSAHPPAFSAAKMHARPRQPCGRHGCRGVTGMFVNSKGVRSRSISTLSTKTANFTPCVGALCIMNFSALIKRNDEFP